MAMTDAKQLEPEQRQALTLLADAGPRGFTEYIILLRGFTKQLLADLVRDGLAVSESEAVPAGSGGRMISITRMRITDAGRRALER